MKIREKLFLILLSIVILFTITFNVVVLQIIQTHLERDKLNDAQNTLKQILLSFEHVSSDISDYVFDSIRQEEIALEIDCHREDPAPLKMKLKNIVHNHSALVDGFVVFDDKIVFTSDCTSTEVYLLDHSTGVFATSKDAFWTMDTSGRLFLRRNIYRVSPYERIGYAVFEIDADYLKTLIGLNNVSCGQICILDVYGNVLLTSSHVAHDDPLFLQLIDRLLQGQTLEREILVANTSYHVIAVNSAVGSDKAIFTVSDTELLHTFFIIQKNLYQFVAAMLVCAALISFSVSHGFTKNLRRLRKNVNRITYDTSENLALRVSSDSKDEIGALACDVNRLLERLEDAHKSSMSHMKESQSAKYELLEWQYRSLQSQVSPHFLCNILSAICAVSAANDPGAVQKLAVDSSRYLRRNLSNCDKKENTLEEELQSVQEYVSLVNAISAVPMELRISCPAELARTLLPTCILQPLIENSVKYGILPNAQTCLVMTVEVESCAADTMSIRVSDNGNGYSEDTLREVERLQQETAVHTQGTGMGILGIIRRLKLMYKGNCQVLASNLPSGGACTTLLIPLSKKPVT